MSKTKPSAAQRHEARESHAEKKSEQRTAKPGHSKGDKHAVSKKPMTSENVLGTWRAC